MDAAPFAHAALSSSPTRAPGPPGTLRGPASAASRLADARPWQLRPDGALYGVSLLGCFELTVEGVIVTVPTSAQRIIAFLALRGRCGRSRLAGSLWPETTQARALASLRTALWRVQQLAPGLLVPLHDSIDLAREVDVDVARLVRTAHLVMQVTPGLPLHHDGEYVDDELLPDWLDDWLVVDRERLRQLRLHVLEAVAARLSDQGRYGMALEAALAAVRADTLRESAHRAVIRIHLAEGNVAEAMHAYDACRTALHQELGLQPSPDTSALVAQGRGVRGPTGCVVAVAGRPLHSTESARHRGDEHMDETGTMDEGRPVEDRGTAARPSTSAAAHAMDEPSTAELEQFLSGVSFPTTRDELLGYAEAHGAGEAVVHGLRNIEQVAYESPHAVSAAFTLEGETTIRYGHVTIYDQ